MAKQIMDKQNFKSEVTFLQEFGKKKEFEGTSHCFLAFDIADMKSHAILVSDP